MTVGRNDPCPCGSGLRFKKCCGVLGEGARMTPLPMSNPSGGVAPSAIPGNLPTAPPSGATQPNQAAATTTADYLATLLKQAIARHQSGGLMDAAKMYRQILTLDPEHADALHLSGLIAQHTGDSDTALSMISQAIRVRPNASFHNSMGNVLQERGDLPAACLSYEQAMVLQADFAPAPFNIGNCLLKLAQLDEAASWYERALAINPEFGAAACGMGNVRLEQNQPQSAENWFQRALQIETDSTEALVGLAQALQAQGSLQRASELFRKALALNADNVAAHIYLGQVLLELGQGAHAVVAYEAAVRSNTDVPEAHYGLANAYLEVGELKQAISSYQRAIALRPEYAEAHYNLGNVYKSQDNSQEAMQCYDQALRCNPDFFAARWAACMSQIPVIYKRVEEIAASRTRYREALELLIKKVRLDTPEEIDAAVNAAGSMQPFFLAYQGHNDRELQVMYGGLMTRIMSAKFPQWSTPLTPNTEPRKRLRVGFVSAFFFSHSNWKLPIKGWIEQLDPEKFALYGYYTGKQASKDEQTDIARKHFERFVEDPCSFEQMCAAIRADELDVLIYPEVCMSPISASLAALRLAPVQCNSWGHPQTSGMTTMDYFLSSDLMEAADAQEHYSEQLVRLPNLSVYYELTDHPQTTLPRSEFGLTEDCPLFFCAQSLFKYLPQHDWIFPAIAERVGKCQFAFIDNPQREVSQRFIDRLVQEFRRKGLRTEDHVIFMPNLQAADYVAMNQLSDVFLDSIGWNGCNSTIEALNCNLPVVTLPGQLMRGLHSQAVLKMIGVEETIAHDVDSYVDIAVKLGTNPTMRRNLANKIADQKYRLTRDKSTIDGLANFLRQVATR